MSQNFNNQNISPAHVVTHIDQSKHSSLRRFITIIIVIIFYQVPPYAVFSLVLYAVFTFNVKVMIILTLISILQTFASRSKAYIKFVNTYIIPLLYFNKVQRYYEETIDPNMNTKCLFTFHPHSVLSFGLLASMNANDDLMSSMTGLSSRFALNVPILGLLLRLWGFEGANPQSLKKLMQKGKPIGLIPGGYQQATLTTPKQLRIYIRQRKGFIKYAINHNYTIYPTLILNQHKAVSTFDHFTKFRLFLNKLKIPGILYFGPLGPFLKPGIQLYIIVGKGIKCDTSTSSQELIDKIHSEYIQQIEKLYRKYKHLNGDSPLVIY